MKYVTKEKIGGKNRTDGKTRKRGKQLLDDLKKTRKYWKLKEEQLALEEAVDLS